MPIENPDNPIDYQDAFDPQDYQPEGWESKESVGPDDTGLLYEGWVDEYGDWDQNIGTGGTLEGGDLGSEASSGLTGRQSGPSGFLPETQAQIANIFSEVIRGGQEREAMRVGSAQLRSSIIRDADKRLPGWREWMRTAATRESRLMSPEVKSFYERHLARQSKSWVDRRDELWREGRFDEYAYHVGPIQQETLRDYWGSFAHASDIKEPRWRRGQRESFVSDYETLRKGRERRSESPAVEGHIATPPGLYEPARSASSRLEDLVEEKRPLGILQAEARQLEDPRRGFDAFREEVLSEESRAYYEVVDESKPADFGPVWHIEDVGDYKQLRDSRRKSNLAHVRDRSVPSVNVLQWTDRAREQSVFEGTRSAELMAVESRRTQGTRGFGISPLEVLRGAQRAERSQAISLGLERGRRFFESGEELSLSIKGAESGAGEVRAGAVARQVHEADVKVMRADQGRAFEMLEDPVFAEVRAKDLEALAKRSARARIATERDRQAVKLHSDIQEDVRAFDLSTPQARRRNIWDLGSERTYGLEIELITDLTRSEMLGEFDTQVSQGLGIVHDESIQTVRSDIAIEQHIEDRGLAGVIREEAAEYETYRSQYTGERGSEIVSRRDFETRYAHELVFPVMQGQAGLDFLGETFERLRRFETELNTSMGMHIHVGSAELSNYELTGVWGAFAARENVIDLMHEPSRRGGGSDYAESLLSRGSLSRVKGAQEIAEQSGGTGRELFLDRAGYGDKYQKLNLRGFEHQTIEYRQPAATLELGEAAQHIGFITEFVDQYAGASFEQAVDVGTSLREGFSGLDLVFEEPSTPGQLMLDLDVVLHSDDRRKRFSEVIKDADEDPNVFYRAVNPLKELDTLKHRSFSAAEKVETEGVYGTRTYSDMLNLGFWGTGYPDLGGSELRIFRGDKIADVGNMHLDEELIRPSEILHRIPSEVEGLGEVSVALSKERLGMREGNILLSDVELFSATGDRSTPEGRAAYWEQVRTRGRRYRQHTGEYTSSHLEDLGRGSFRAEDFQEAEQIEIDFGDRDVVLHSDDASRYHEASRMGLDLEDPPEARAAQSWGVGLEGVVKPPVSTVRLTLDIESGIDLEGVVKSPLGVKERSLEFEDSPLDLFDEEVPSDLFDEEVPSDLFDEPLVQDDVAPDLFDETPVLDDILLESEDVSSNFFQESLVNVDPFGLRDAPLAITGEKYPPTASQQRALEHTYGPAVVMAGPGSGKSRTLIERLKYLSRENLATPDDVLTLVFGKKAETELTARSREIGGDWNIKTIDAFALSVVKENFGELGYSAAPKISTGSFEGFLRGRRNRFRDWGITGENVPEDLIKNWAEDYETTRGGFVEGREDYSGLSEPLQRAIHEFRRGKLQANQLDFSDALSQAGYLLESNPELRTRYREEFPFVQVDEFQDVSPTQSRLLGQLSPNLWAVGDFDQSIMSFRGGGGEAMGEMIHRGAALYNIEENFRSTPEIVGAAQGFISENLGRMEISQASIKPSGEDVSVVNVPTSQRGSQVISRIADEIREGEQTAILTRTLRERDTLRSRVGTELGERGWEAEDIEQLLSFESLHASKGREWQNVILPVNLLDRQMGSGRDVTLPTHYAKTASDFAEEERLFYVGMTRAEERLTIMGEPYHPYVQKVAGVLGEQRASRAEDFLGEPPALGEVTRGALEALEIERIRNRVEESAPSLGERFRSFFGMGSRSRKRGDTDVELHSDVGVDARVGVSGETRTVNKYDFIQNRYAFGSFLACC